MPTVSLLAIELKTVVIISWNTTREATRSTVDTQRDEPPFVVGTSHLLTIKLNLRRKSPARPRDFQEDGDGRVIEGINITIFNEPSFTGSSSTRN